VITAFIQKRFLLRFYVQSEPFQQQLLQNNDDDRDGNIDDDDDIEGVDDDDDNDNNWQQPQELQTTVHEMIPLSPPGIQMVKLIQSTITTNNTKTNNTGSTCTAPSFDLWIQFGPDSTEQ
jgi:hypothetical protein